MERVKLEFLRSCFVSIKAILRHGKKQPLTELRLQTNSSSSRVDPAGRIPFSGCPSFYRAEPAVLNQARAAEKAFAPVIGWSLPDDSNIRQLQLDPESVTEAFLIASR